MHAESDMLRRGVSAKKGQTTDLSVLHDRRETGRMVTESPKSGWWLGFRN
jgi:hypothetical protein